jgi:hypothetical protein
MFTFNGCPGPLFSNSTDTLDVNIKDRASVECEHKGPGHLLNVNIRTRTSVEREHKGLGYLLNVNIKDQGIC